MKRTVRITSDTMKQIAEALTGYGEINNIEDDGTIVFTMEGDDEFLLGYAFSEVERDLRAIDTVEVNAAKSVRAL